MRNKLFLIGFLIVILSSLCFAYTNCLQNQANVSYGCGDILNANAYSYDISLYGQLLYADGNYFTNASFTSQYTHSINYSIPTNILNATLNIYFDDISSPLRVSIPRYCLNSSQNLYINTYFNYPPAHILYYCNDVSLLDTGYYGLDENSGSPILKGKLTDYVYNFRNVAEIVINWTFPDIIPQNIIIVNTTTTNKTLFLNLSTNDANLKNITINVYNSTSFNVNKTYSTNQNSTFFYNATKNGIYFYNITTCNVYGNCNTTKTYNFTISYFGGGLPEIPEHQSQLERTMVTLPDAGNEISGFVTNVVTGGLAQVILMIAVLVMVVAVIYVIGGILIEKLKPKY